MKQYSRLHLDDKKIIQTYLKLKSYKKTVEVCNCSRKSVATVLRRNNITPFPRYRRLDSKKIIEYFRKTKSREKTADFYHCSNERVYNVLIENNIAVPRQINKETETIILDLWDRGYSIFPIAEKLKLWFYVIKAVLKESHRILGRHANKRSLDPEEVIKKYKESRSIIKTGKHFRCSITPIYRILNENHILRSTRKYMLNEDAFKRIDTPGKAWFLGWFATDGRRTDKSGIGFHLAAKDKDVLLKLGNVLSSTHKAFEKDGKVWIRFHSKKLRQSLEIFGFSYSKYPFTEQILKFIRNLPQDLKPHFWRGVVEGDGGIEFQDGRKATVKMYSASSSFCETFLNFLKKDLNLNIKANVRKSDYNPKWRPMYHVGISGHQMPMQILDSLYKNNDGFFLKRKKDKYLWLKEFFRKKMTKQKEA